MLLHLCRCGVVVHHAARMPPLLDGRESVVVFLEGTLGQYELARRCALRMPGVLEVSFSGQTRAIMYVYSAEPGGATAPLRRPRSRPPTGHRRDPPCCRASARLIQMSNAVPTCGAAHS